MKFKPLLLIVLCSALVACGIIKPQVVHYPHNQAVRFNGFEFSIEKISSGLRLTNQKPNPYADTKSRWVVVTMNMKNTENTPIQYIYHPKFKLYSSSGAEYSEDLELGMLENRKTGYNSLQPINPQILIKRMIYFQVQPGSYDLAVVVPTSVRSGLVSTTTYGEKFVFDIPDVQ